MDCKALFETIDGLNEKYLQVWEDVCNIESPTSSKAGVDAVADYFVKMAKERGWQIEKRQMEAAGDPVCITINPEAQEKSVVLSGHIDTVHDIGLFGTPAVRKDAENIYGPGVTDCKGGVVACFMAMEALDRCGFRRRPVKLFLQTDEETGSKNSGKKTVEFMCEAAKDAAAFLNTESYKSHTAVLVRKGILRFRFHITGKAVHSASCQQGANAVAEAAHKILKLEEMKDPQGLTCNCGVIQGGTVANTVAEKCTFTADIRFANAQQQAQAEETVYAVAAETAISGCTCEVEKVSFRPAMALTERNEALLEEINAIYEKAGLPRLAARSCLSGSDAAYITGAGIPCVDDLGVEGLNIHSIREYARLDSLAESAKRLASVAYCL